MGSTGSDSSGLELSTVDASISDSDTSSVRAPTGESVETGVDSHVDADVGPGWTGGFTVDSGRGGECDVGCPIPLRADDNDRANCVIADGAEARCWVLLGTAMGEEKGTPGVDVDRGGEPELLGERRRRVVFLVRERKSPRSSYEDETRSSVDDVLDSGRWVCGQRLLRKGTRTDSSISSCTLSEAAFSASGLGGRESPSCASSSSRTSLGRLTSRGPFGRMYACIKRCHRPKTYTVSSLPGLYAPPDFNIIFS
jgi:hypothetical protein